MANLTLLNLSYHSTGKFATEPTSRAINMRTGITQPSGAATPEEADARLMACVRFLWLPFCVMGEQSNIDGFYSSLIGIHRRPPVPLCWSKISSAPPRGRELPTLTPRRNLQYFMAFLTERDPFYSGCSKCWHKMMVLCYKQKFSAILLWWYFTFS